MSKPFVVLADLDANYLIPLEDKLTEELYDQIDLEIITNSNYFDIFFSTYRKIDTLIISAALFKQDLLRHNITDIFILSEDMGNTQSLDNITHIFKYSSTTEIFNQILYKNKKILNVQSNNKSTQIIAVTSGIGGSGKTTLSLALSKCLARSHKRVLYISTDLMQGFSYYLQNKYFLPNDIVKLFNHEDDTLYSKISPYLRNEEFTYLPPFEHNILSIGLNNTIYNRIISVAKAARDFDYIIVDTKLDFDESTAEIIQTADKVIVNVLQDSFSIYKTEQLVRNIDCTNKEKFFFVCNKFQPTLNNEYLNSQVGQKFIVTEYIEEVSSISTHLLDSFVTTTGVKNLTFLLN